MGEAYSMRSAEIKILLFLAMDFSENVKNAFLSFHRKALVYLRQIVNYLQSVPPCFPTLTLRNRPNIKNNVTIKANYSCRESGYICSGVTAGSSFILMLPAGKSREFLRMPPLGLLGSIFRV